jgi:wyosine [tRNA(Phe)-imidazoG37] synthetase (radical SAM superfamily)
LGRSLGVDILFPPKTCTFDCVYCQLGSTVKKVSAPEDLKDRMDVNTILQDLRAAFKTIPLQSLDYVTFSGSGEPTLNLMLGRMIDGVRKSTKNIPIAVLTNASLVSRKDVRMNLSRADLVVAKLDAPDQDVFEAVNRPAKNLTLSSIVEGLKLLRQEINGRLALQIMLFHSSHGLDNSGESSIEGLTRLSSAIKPDEVQINTPTRPPSEKFVLPLRAGEVEQISKRFRKALPDVHIVMKSSPRQSRPAKERRVDEEEILELLKRRPCRLVDVVEALGLDKSTVVMLIKRLEVSSKIIAVALRGDIYYKAT